MDFSRLTLLLLSELLTTISTDTVQQIYIKDNKVPLKGGDVQIVCEVSQFTNEVVRVYKTDTLPQDITDASSVTGCIPSQCLGTVPRHTFSTSSSGITITVTNLNRSEDQTYWTCAINNRTEYMQLTVYTITPSLQYDNPPTQNRDLVQTSVTFSCSTGCAYPAPNFIWYYIKTSGSRQEWSTTAAVSYKTGGCTDSEKIYTSTLTLPRNTQFIDNTDTTVKFQCGAISITGAENQRFTPASVDVRFAVQVTGSTLKDGSSTVSGQLQVVSGISKTLTCEASLSRPAAKIVWYIGSQEKQRSTSTALTFNPQNSDHNKQVYCKAFNTQPESQAVTSYKSTLFVQERATVKSFYIGQNESQTVATFEEHDVNIPLTCVVSGMPASEIYVSFNGDIIARESNTNKLQYNFRKIACTKSGVYICKGFDIFETFTSRTVELFVECSPRPVRQVLHNITSQIGSSISLIFKVIAYPEPGPKGFKWFIEDRLNWIALLSNEDFEISSSGLETNLTISNASREQYGKYRVTAVNKIGSYDQIFFLSEKDSRSNSCISTIKTSYTTSIVLGAVCVVVVVYATGLTILYKRKIQKKGTSSHLTDGNKTNDSMVNRSDITVVRQNEEKTSVIEKESDKQYTELTSYSNDNTAYELLQI